MSRRRSHNRNRAVFLDRDGVINEVVFREGQPVSPRTLREFRWTKHIRKAICNLKEASFFVFVVTNQPDVARKKMKLQTLQKMSTRIKKYLAVDDIESCIHDSIDKCSCRKPLPGMIKTLAKKWDIDLNASYVVGDLWKDMEAGKSAGCKTILIETSYNRGTESQFKVSSISDAVHLILKSGAGQ